MPTLQLVVNRERSDRLAAGGFLNVTGLPKFRASHGPEGIIQPRADQMGCWDQNNNMVVIVTDDGEVWLRKASDTIDFELIHELCPHKGASVPCSNGEEIPFYFMMERIGDPYSDCGGNASPIPDPQ